MIRSMTAFARITLPAGGKRWVVEIRSLNQRYFELALRLPPQHLSFEQQIRSLVQTILHRGKVSLNISEEGRNGETAAYEMDEAQVRRYLISAKKVKRQFGLEGKLGVEDILRLPGVIREKINTDLKLLTWANLSRILKKVLEKAVQHKTEEGEKLDRDFRHRQIGRAHV